MSANKLFWFCGWVLFSSFCFLRHFYSSSFLHFIDFSFQCFQKIYGSLSLFMSTFQFVINVFNSMLLMCFLSVIVLWLFQLISFYFLLVFSSFQHHVFVSQLSYLTFQHSIFDFLFFKYFYFHQNFILKCFHCFPFKCWWIFCSYFFQTWWPWWW